MWRFRKNNLIINDQDNFAAHKAHLEKLFHIKSHIQNKGPEMPYFLKNKISTNHLLRSKEDKKCYENAIIFSRLLEIDSSKSYYNKTKCPLYCAAFDFQKYNFDKEEKMRDTQRENQKIFVRLIKQKSHYPTKKFLNVNYIKNYYKSIARRQRFDNPNINYATFNEFKDNILQSYNLRKVHSVRNFGTLNKRRKKNDYNFSDTNVVGRNYNDLNYVSNTRSPVSSYRNFINNKNRFNSTGIFNNMENNKNKIGKKITRSQSAYFRK